MHPAILVVSLWRMRFRLRLGLSLASLTALRPADGRLFDAIYRLAEATEASGFDALFVPDHVQQNATGGGRHEPMLEAYTLLGALAARTERLQLGAFVTPVTFRNPALLAKTITTLDVVSHGRAVLGIGAGWDADEHAGYGFDFPAPLERLARLDEALTICRAMFDEPIATYAGRYYRTGAAVNAPGPVRQPPVLVGGGGARTLRLAARHADAINISAHDLGAVPHRIKFLERACADAGRDPTEITRTAFLVPHNSAHVEQVARSLPDLGVDGLILALTSADAAEIASYGRLLDKLMPGS
ncbi:MAG: hypothetical protein JWL97_4042 [Gemmatimonadales bacterium]|nr:hypothetical protein [Gemmatimonadales bacterium]